jgi:guanosine-3',5'-bis(diphosphate) 3'-pyrophosphohydrolase
MQHSVSDHSYELEAMEDFLTYDEKDLADDEQVLIKSILSSAQKYLSKEELSHIHHTYEYAAKAHTGQKRLSGEDYITHPLRATQILMTLKPDCATIQACILHDVIEDTPITYDDIVREFGTEVARLCEWLVKVAKVRYQGEDRQIETLKKTFLAMADDLRVIFIKLADRIHNIQTLHFHPNEEKKTRIANETMKIYVPICKKLWLYQFQLYLENGAFKILHAREYGLVMAFLRKKYTQSDKYITRGITRLHKLLHQGGMQGYTITGRTKSPYRIYEKLIKKYQTLDFSKVLDVIAFRIIARSVPDCYNALGIIHAHFNPLINKIKDYISIPKANNYQSLHTTILGMYPFPVEIQIRTKSMNDVAEFGVAAHYAYKNDSIQNKSLTERQAQRLVSLQDSVHKHQQNEKQQFKEKISIELLDNNIFVYTPKWEVIELPKWSTVLDFAFRVHTDVGLRFNNATVNGIIKPIGHLLQSWDVINVNTFKHRYTATRYWIDYLHMPTAKAKLARFLKQQEKDIYITKWTELLNAKLVKYDLPLLYNDKDKIQKHYGTGLEHLLMQLASKATTSMTILKEVYGISWEKNVTPIKKEDTKTTKSKLWTRIIVDNQPFLQYELCPLCMPKPGERVIARSGKDGIKIHTLSCKALATVSYDKLIKAYRVSDHSEEKTTTDYHFSLSLVIPSHGSNLIWLMTVFQELWVQIDSVKIDKVATTGNYHISVESLYENPSKIAYILNYLDKHYPHIISMKKEIR